MEHLVSFWICSPSKKQKKVETSKQVMYRLYVSGAKRTVSPSTLRRRDWKWLNLIESDEFCTLVHWSEIFRYWNYKCSVCSCLLEDPWNQQNSCGCGIHSRLPLLKSPNVWYKPLDKPEILAFWQWYDKLSKVSFEHVWQYGVRTLLKPYQWASSLPMSWNNHITI